jgi:hypothetical protein
MDEHEHDFVDGWCVTCGEKKEVWRCMTCGHPMEDGEHCYLPACVENRVRAERRMGARE